MTLLWTQISGKRTNGLPRQGKGCAVSYATVMPQGYGAENKG